MTEILVAELKDAEEIINLQRLAYQSEAKLYNNWSLPALTQTIDSLNQEFENSLILKAVINNTIIGSVRAKIEDKVCKIGRLIVHPAFQKQGIGSNLLQSIEHFFENEPKIKSFELFTGNKSLSNIRLYEKHGYVISHTQPLSEMITLSFLIKPKR
ncbi:MAG: hypothetical protein RLZZ215_2633 [Pseudomonadota bacterium]|jgi:ribosomal protein S18 acetylase RimI-like enzyme